MHGIERTREDAGPMERGVGVTRIVVRYSDGREVNFVPDAGRTAFSEDDMLVVEERPRPHIRPRRVGRHQHAPGVLGPFANGPYKVTACRILFRHLI